MALWIPLIVQSDLPVQIDLLSPEGYFAIDRSPDKFIVTRTEGKILIGCFETYKEIEVTAAKDDEANLNLILSLVSLL